MADQPPVADEEDEPQFEDAIEQDDEAEDDEFHLAEEDLQLDDLVDPDENQDDDEDDIEEEEEEEEPDGAQLAAVAGLPALLRLLPRRLAWPQHRLQVPPPAPDPSAIDAANSPHLVTFNRRLPSEHVYLGDDLEAPSTVSPSVSTYSATSATVLELPCLTCSLGVLLPGQLLPVALFHPSDVALVSEMHAGRISQVAVLHRYRYSSTAELLSCREEVDDNVGLTMIRAKLIGRRRFEVLNVRRDIAGRMWAKIRLLPEPKQMSPCPLRSSPRRSLALSASPFPAWAADAYDAQQLVTAVRAELTSCNRSWAEVQAGPDEPAAFANWLLEQLPLPDWLRADLLGSPHPAGCLRRCLRLLRRCTTLHCVRCLCRVADKSAIFCLAAGGATGAYVNPGGHVHEMMTVTDAAGVRLVGRPSTEHSWFPGYAWQILECAQCSRHMGWRFTAQQADTRPAAFYGLCRASVQPDLAASLEDNLEDSGELAAESAASARVLSLPE